MRMKTPRARKENVAMEYKFVTRDCGEELENAVNASIQHGWVPIGGGSVCAVPLIIEHERKGYTEHEIKWVYAQAMTRASEQAE